MKSTLMVIASVASGVSVLAGAIMAVFVKNNFAKKTHIFSDGTGKPLFVYVEDCARDREKCAGRVCVKIDELKTALDKMGERLEGYHDDVIRLQLTGTKQPKE